MHALQHIGLILALISPAISAPAKTGFTSRNAAIRQNKTIAPYNIWVGGNRLMALSSDVSASSPDKDIREIAQQFVADWQAPQDTSTDQVGVLTGTTSPGSTPLRLYLDYTLGLTQCQVATPQVTWEGSMLSCNTGGGCSETVSSETSSTDTRQTGYKLGVSVTGTIGFDVELVEEASVSVTVNSEASVDFSTSTTTTTTQSYTYNLDDGDFCAPTTVAFVSTCTGQITVNQFQFQALQSNGQWANFLYVGSSNGPQAVNDICQYWDSNTGDFSTSDLRAYLDLESTWENSSPSTPGNIAIINQICSQSQLSGGFSQSMYVSNEGNQFNLQGCSLPS